MNMQVIEKPNVRVRSGLMPTVVPTTGSVVRSLAPEDEVLLDRLLCEPADFVDHPDFDKPGMERALFGAASKLVSANSTRFAEAAHAITDAVAAGERVPTLSVDQERHLFMRYNFARREVQQILRKYAGKRISVTGVRHLLAWGRRAMVARSVIVRLNLPLVLAMSKRTRLTNIDYNEMISEGNMALLRSVEKFDC